MKSGNIPKEKKKKKKPRKLQQKVLP